MHVVMIVEDNKVIVEGQSETIDLSSLDGMHAVQWNGTTGEVEYSMSGGSKLPPSRFDDFEPFQPFVDAWMIEAQRDAS